MQRLTSWLWNAATTAALLVRDALASLRYNWGIALLSLGLAISLWVFVTNRNDPDVTGRVPGTVPIEAVNVPREQAVFSLSQSFVSVRVRAPENVFNGLTPEDFRAVIDLSAAAARTVTVDVRVESNEPRVQVVEVSPAQVQVELENVTLLAVPVRAHLVGTPPRGFEVGKVTVQPEEVVVTGPQSLVQRVEAAEADVNLTGLPTTFQQTLLLQPRDARGGKIEGVTLGPDSASVRVEVIQQEFSAVFVVLPEVSGTPANGFSVTGIQVDPVIVVVSGKADVFQSLDPSRGIMTEAVTIDGASADVVRPVSLRLPQGASVAQATVTVRITIAPTRTEPG